MEIKSSVFKEGTLIPSRYTCDDIDVSPPLEWSHYPAGTKTFALICDDPDAPMGTYVHWVIFNIPGHITSLSENIPGTDHLSNGALQGRNDFGRSGYGGPCPPSGTHRYYFKLYAVNREIDSRQGMTKNELLKAIEGHVLAEAQIMGRYKRS
jgi:Raf kinase inhibitor-like YbhB/YbcL family protein